MINDADASIDSNLGITKPIFKKVNKKIGKSKKSINIKNTNKINRTFEKE